MKFEYGCEKVQLLASVSHISGKGDIVSFQSVDESEVVSRTMHISCRGSHPIGSGSYS